MTDPPMPLVTDAARRPSLSRTLEASALSWKARSVSIIVLPTKWIFSSGIPSRRRFSSPLPSVTNKRSETWSVSTRLISSGMLRSKERRPASTCATSGRKRPGPLGILAVTRAEARVELTSPTTITMSGFSRSTTSSNFFIISAVWHACDPEPTPRWTFGVGRSRSRKKEPDMESS